MVKAFQKELKAFFPEGKVMTTDFNVELSAACQIADAAFQLPLVEDKNYFNALLELCLKHAVKLIIPTIDTELLLLAQHKKAFLKHGIVPVVSEKDFIKICRDKRTTNRFFEQHHIPSAREYSKYDYSLPLFIKPINGSRSIDTFTIRRHEELTEYHFKNDNLMFLEYLDRNFFEEYTCDMYYDSFHKLKAVVPRKRIEVRDGEVNKGITEKNSIVDFLKERLDYIDGAVGCLTAQFFKHKETDAIYGIEINARFGGGYPLSYLAGANFPKWLIREYFFNESIPFYNDWEDRLLMLRYDKEILVHDKK